MKLLNLRNSFTLFLFIIILLFVIIAFGYPPKAGIGPLAIGIPALILLVVVFVQDNTKRKVTQAEIKEEKERTALTFRDYHNIILWIIGLLVLSYLFGIVLVFPLFVLAYIKAKGFSWRLSIILAACVFAVMFGGYKILLQSPLYEGYIFEKFF